MPQARQYSLRAIVTTMSIVFIILSVLVLVKEPAYGRENLSPFCTLVRNAAPVLMLVSCLSITLFAVKLRILAIIGMILMIGSLVISYFIAQKTGQSMGTAGWSSTFLSMFVIIPTGLFLCILTGCVSLTHILENQSSARIPVYFSAAAIVLLGVGYFFADGIKPDVYSLFDEMKSDDAGYGRFSIAVKISEIAEDEIVPLLIDLLEDNDPRIREAAVVALGGKPRKATAEALLPVLKALKTETDEKTKEWMIRKLVSLTPLAEKADRDIAVDSLIEILQCENRVLQGAAAESLGWIKDERAIPSLIDALSDNAFDAHNALISITGKRLGRNPEGWRKWFEETKHSISKPE